MNWRRTPHNTGCLVAESSSCSDLNEVNLLTGGFSDPLNLAKFNLIHGIFQTKAKYSTVLIKHSSHMWLNSKKINLFSLISIPLPSVHTFSLAHLFPPFLLPLISVPVCHHWDHRNLCVRRVPQIFEETQTALHPGLLRLLLHPGISHDHRGKTQRHTSMYAHTDLTPQRTLKHPPCALWLFLWISRQISACKAKLQPSEDRLNEWNKRGWVLLKSPQTASDGKIQPKGFIHVISYDPVQGSVAVRITLTCTSLKKWWRRGVMARRSFEFLF